MKTFTEIEYLLDELKNVQKGQQIMLEQGMVDRTPAGAMFFMGTMQRTNGIYERLSKYPARWVQAVERIIELRKRTNYDLNIDNSRHSNPLVMDA